MQRKRQEEEVRTKFPYFIQVAGRMIYVERIKMKMLSGGACSEADKVVNNIRCFVSFAMSVYTLLSFPGPI